MALKFYNSEKENENYKIEIFGEIGESWFDEGFSIQTLANHLKNSQGKPIDIIINSLGGDVDTAFAVYDILKAYKPKKNVQIIGMTASAATIIAMAGDSVQMSKNALALIHNASTITMGNAEEHRKAVEDLEKVDSIIVGIYREKSGKPKSTFYTAMEKEQWLTAQEMKDLGLIDKIIEPRDISNSVIEKINNSALPKIQNNNQNFIDMTKEELKNMFDDFLKGIKNIVAPNAAHTATSTIEDVAKERDELKEKIKNFEPKVTEIENKISEVSKLNETLSNDLATVKNSLTEKEKAINEVKAEFAAYCKERGDKAGFIKNGGNEADYVEPIKNTGATEIDPVVSARLSELVSEAGIEIPKNKKK